MGSFGGAGAQGWTRGAPNWTASYKAGGDICTTVGGNRGLEMYCINNLEASNFGPPNSGASTITFPFPTSGLLLYLWTTQTAAYWLWARNIVGEPDGGLWWCGGPTYAIPYYCPFNEIECLQPVTLEKLPYFVNRPGDAPAGVQFSEACSGYPSSITIAPA